MTYAGESVVVGHLVGMLHVAVLLANPLREIPSIELAGGVNALGMSARRHTGSAQVVLDPEAAGSYGRRLDELRAEAGRLDALGDQGRAAAVQAEIDWLVRELATASGLSGRVRTFTDNPERARVAVGQAVRRAIARVELVAPTIGTHLRESVYTGARCVYQPA